MVSLWNTLVYEPLYNILIFLVGFIPGHELGVAIIVLTVLVKAALLPTAIKAAKAQRAMRALEPDMAKIREKYKDKKEEIAKATMALYQEKGVHPFSGCLPILIQIPIILGLYWVFMDGVAIDPSVLYSFVSHPETVDLNYLGLHLEEKNSLILAFLAGISQFGYGWWAIPVPPKLEEPRGKDAQPDFGREMARTMQIQMRYVLPIFIVFVSYSFSAAVALYWTVSNIWSIGQELVFRRTLGK